MDKEVLEKIVKDNKKMIEELLADGSISQTEAEMIYTILVSGEITKKIESV